MSKKINMDGYEKASRKVGRASEKLKDAIEALEDVSNVVREEFDYHPNEASGFDKMAERLKVDREQLADLAARTRIESASKHILENCEKYPVSGRALMRIGKRLDIEIDQVNDIREKMAAGQMFAR